MLRNSLEIKWSRWRSGELPTEPRRLFSNSALNAAEFNQVQYVFYKRSYN